MHSLSMFPKGAGPLGGPNIHILENSLGSRKINVKDWFILVCLFYELKHPDSLYLKKKNNSLVENQIWVIVKNWATGQCFKGQFCNQSLCD